MNKKRFAKHARAKRGRVSTTAPWHALERSLTQFSYDFMVEGRMPSHAALRASMPRLKKGSEKRVRAERDER